MRRYGNILFIRTDHRLKYGACAFHARYLSIQTPHSQKTKYFLLFRCIKDARTHLIVTLYVHCLYCYIQIETQMTELVDHIIMGHYS